MVDKNMKLSNNIFVGFSSFTLFFAEPSFLSFLKAQQVVKNLTCTTLLFRITSQLTGNSLKVSIQWYSNPAFTSLKPKHPLKSPIRKLLVQVFLVKLHLIQDQISLFKFLKRTRSHGPFLGFSAMNDICDSVSALWFLGKMFHKRSPFVRDTLGEFKRKI